MRNSRADLDVILNRILHKRKGACSVLREPSQFSWYRAGMSWKTTQQMRERYGIVAAMPKVFKDKSVMFFHAKRIGKPKWAKGMVRVGQIDEHVYYREKQ